MALNKVKKIHHWQGRKYTDGRLDQSKYYTSLLTRINKQATLKLLEFIYQEDASLSVESKIWKLKCSLLFVTDVGVKNFLIVLDKIDRSPGI